VVLQLGFPITGACGGGTAAADAAAGSCKATITTISAAAAVNGTDAAEVWNIIVGYKVCVDLYLL